MATTGRTTPTRKTASKPAAPKAAPKPEFHFSIKQAQSEREEVKAEKPVVPYTVEGLNDEAIVFRNPGEIGWQESAALSLRDPFGAVRTMLVDEEYEKFVEMGDFEIEILRDLIKAWMAHHGVPTPGN